MPINYAIKYAEQIAERFKRASVTDDDCGHNYTWLNPHSKTIRVGSMNTVPLTQYTRSGSARFGPTYDVGDTLQEMECKEAPSFSSTIDALDGSDRAIQVSAGKFLRTELDEVMTPYVDKHRLKKWVMGANIQVKETTAPTKSTIGGMIIDLNAKMTDALVPLDGRMLYIGTEYYKLLKQNPDWLGVDALGKEALTKGVVGEFDGCRVKPIPSTYMPSGVYFFIKHKNSTVDPVKLAQYDIIQKVAGLSGPLVQGVCYFDAFVLGARGDGVAVCGNAAVLDAPALAIASHKVTITESAGVVFKYTTDGSNPRYSTTAQVYTAAVTLSEGQTLRAIGTKEGCVGKEATQAYA